MRRAAWFVLVIVLASFGARSETATFPWGSLEAVWADDAVLSIRVTLDVAFPQTSSASMMWVLTVNAQRFGDGVHSWQLHLSPTYASIVVIPNDFLAARRFTLEQLHIEGSTSESGDVLNLLVPRSGPIAELIAPGDTLEVHALWLQQAPLVAARVPDIWAPSGSGGSSPESSYVPADSVIVKGTPIRHAFPLVDAETGEPVAWGTATIALVRIRENMADEIIRYIYREPDPTTGLVSYEFDTLNLSPGIYDLVIWVNPPGVTVRHRIELISATP